MTPLTSQSAAAEEKDPLADKSAMEIIVIASEGLAESFEKNTKLDAIRKALKKALTFVTKGTHVGLRISGHRVAKSDAEQSCADSELALRPDEGNGAKVASKLSGIRPQGKRSVVKSLSLGLADLAKYGGTKTILLITDGMDDCLDQDPIAYLAPASLKNQNYVIHIRGVGLSTADAASLKAIADGTGGSFASAKDGFSLTQQMSIGAQRAASPPQPSTPSDAPAPAGSPTSPVPPAPSAPTQATIARTPPPPPVPKPIPFDPNELVQKFVKEMKATIAKLPQPSPQQAPPPPPPPKTFSRVSILIIGVETLLLILSFAVIILLIVKKRQD